MSEDSMCRHDVPLSRAEAWTLHHVLLDWLQRDDEAERPGAAPPSAVRAAFETVDAGGTTFTAAQLDAIQPILAAYHHAPPWEPDRARLEQLLYRVTAHRDRAQPALPDD